MTAIEPADLIINDLRSSALLVFLTYIEEKRRLRPHITEDQGLGHLEDAAYFDALDEVRRYVTELVEPERVAS